MTNKRKPVDSLSAGGGEVTRPSVASGDSIYYRHPETGNAHHGTVAAIGRHGVTVDADGGGEHQVRWDAYLGHRKRAERRLTIVDRGEDGSIMRDEDGKLVFVRGQLHDDPGEADQELTKSLPLTPAGPTLLEKAQIVRELSAAGFEPMVDYVRDMFGDGFVYRQQAPVSTEDSDIRASLERLAANQGAQFQGLCSAIAMLAERVGEAVALQRAAFDALVAANPKNNENTEPKA